MRVCHHFLIEREAPFRRQWTLRALRGDRRVRRRISVNGYVKIGGSAGFENLESRREELVEPMDDRRFVTCDGGGRAEKPVYAVQVGAANAPGCRAAVCARRSPSHRCMVAG